MGYSRRQAGFWIQRETDNLMNKHAGVGPWIFPYTVLSGTHEKNMAGCVPGFSCTLYSVELIKEYAWWVWIFPNIYSEELMKEYWGVCPWIFFHIVLRGTYERIRRGLSLDFPLHCTQWNSSKNMPGGFGFSSTVYLVELMKKIMVGLDFPLQRNLWKNMAGSVPGFSSTLYSVELMKEYGGVCPWIFFYIVLNGTYEKNHGGFGFSWLGSLDFPLHIFFLYASNPSVEWGTVGNNYWWSSAMPRSRWSGIPSNQAITIFTRKLMKVENPAIQNAFKGTGPWDRIQIYLWKNTKCSSVVMSSLPFTMLLKWEHIREIIFIGAISIDFLHGSLFFLLVH